MNNEIKECEYQNICVNFNDNLYSKCPVFGWGNECCYAILYKQLLAEQAKNKKLVEALEEISGCTQHKSDFCNHQSDCSFCRMHQAQQALNEVNNAK